MAETIARSNLLNRLIRYGPLAIWIGVIFYFSSSFGSFNETSRFIRPLLEFLFPNFSAEAITVYHGYIRKSAHFVTYAVLGFLAGNAFSTSSKRAIHRSWFIVSLSLVLIVATLDESNQSFSALRTASFYDVLIDLAGGTAALAAFGFILSRRSRPYG